jgi:oxaloacetate decarboxylase alpha subunit
MATLKLTELVLRDAHQSLLATRLRLDDMLPIAQKLDQVGYWSVESWGGATFDACIRYLGEDPWERIREIKKAMPNTPQQMLLRGQNLLGYRHYADDVVEKFVERAYANGVEVFRIFDAMNDIRNLETAIRSTISVGGHAQGTISYTVSPVHSIQTWVDMARNLEDLGVHSICIKDMAGLLKPYTCEELIKQLKQAVDVPIAMQCHATTGLSTATYQKAIDAGIDMLDTAISSMSMTYGHSATETFVSILEGTDRDTQLDLNLLDEIASYFRDVRKKYARFEGSLKGVDSRILVAQVPGGMLTNMENQLKEQQAEDKIDAVLKEIPKVRQDLGFIPLVTPTSQIVGSQAVLNVLTGERYKSITKETAGVLKGEYGATPAPVDSALQQRVLGTDTPITVRPADLIKPEFLKIQTDLTSIAQDKKLRLSEELDDDTLTYALFPMVGLKFIENRDNPDAFEKLEEQPIALVANQSTSADIDQIEAYSVKVDGQVYDVEVGPKGVVSSIVPSTPSESQQSATPTGPSAGVTQKSPLSGNVLKVLVSTGEQVAEGQVVIMMEAMKMETEIKAISSGTVQQVLVSVGDTVESGQPLLSIG